MSTGHGGNSARKRARELQKREKREAKEMRRLERRALTETAQEDTTTTTLNPPEHSGQGE